MKSTYSVLPIDNEGSCFVRVCIDPPKNTQSCQLRLLYDLSNLYQSCQAGSMGWLEVFTGLMAIGTRIFAWGFLRLIRKTLIYCSVTENDDH